MKRGKLNNSSDNYSQVIFTGNSYTEYQAVFLVTFPTPLAN